uniref:UPF3 domain-containing protein n=1 Tax=Clastoptera arizonana TaxID=38151 RepID=A0A1B6CPX6_9HEMI
MKEGLEKDQSKKEHLLIKENCDPSIDNVKKKIKEEKPSMKVVVRRLPPTMTEATFKEQVSPLPPHDYMYFVQADSSLAPFSFCRAYINFISTEDLFMFTEKFDNYVFVDSKGQEYPAVVEFAPFQRIPKHRPNRKKDPKMGTIEQNQAYIEFKERLEAEMLESKTAANAVKQHFFETSNVNEEKKEVTTPLLDFVRHRRVERQRIREEKREEKRKRDLERRRAKDEQRKTRKDEDNPVLKVLHSVGSNKEKPKERDGNKASITKKRIDESKSPKEKVSFEIRSRDNKNRIGKSYLEERQKQAERREEMKKKSTLNKSQNNLSESKISLNDSKEDVEKPKSSFQDKHSEYRNRDSDYKKTDRTYRKDDLRKPVSRSDTRRDRDDYGKRRNGKISESRPNSRREEEKRDEYPKRKNSDGKRTSECTNLDRNKERTRSKPVVKKSIDVVHDKKPINGFENGSVERKDESNDIINGNKSESGTSNSMTKRRNSLESGMLKHLNNNKDKLKHEEPNRRNSLDSQNSILNDEKLKMELKHKLKILKGTSNNDLEDENKIKKNDLDKTPKRRKSMEEISVDGNKLTNSDKNRRNSLGSGDHRENLNVFDKSCEKPENDIKKVGDGEKQNKDPRTIRRIRNKDRPTLEIYRPGMGRFSKQRLEREKVLGSSTEVESPSSSPSPTPVLKSKTPSNKEHH